MSGARKSARQPMTRCLAEEAPMKILIVYYSYSHGNTKKIAEALRKATGADIERIETVKKYGPYEETVEVGQAEVQRGECPPLRPMM